VAFLTLVVALVVGNTMKLSGLTRQGEAEILRLVGAPRWYIQLPLLAEGAVQGLLGSGLAMAILKAVQAGLADVLAESGFPIQVRFLPAWEAVLIAAIVVAVCVLSSWVALREDAAR
jgi:cell division transport system permease protein